MTAWLALPGLVLAVLLAAQALWRRAALRRPRVQASGKVVLLLPLTGPAPGLDALLSALATQTLPPARLVVAVEDATDPAHARITALAGAQPFPVQVVLAGTCGHRGQKNTNLLAALAALQDPPEALVLLDADIRPQPWWLSALASPVLTGEYALVTGFRWQGLAGRGLAGQLMALLDRNCATLSPPARWGLAWGGSLALSPQAVAALDLPRLLDRALVDDLTIAARARGLGLRMLTRGALLLPTPAEGTAREQLAFLRRQLQVARLCRPGLWWAFPLMSHAVLLTWAVAPALWPALAALGLVRGLAQASIGRWLGAPDPPGATLAQLALAATPLPDLLLAAASWASFRVRRIGWRHVHYAVAGPNQVRVLARRRAFPPAPAFAPCPITGQPAALEQDISAKLLEDFWRIGTGVRPTPLTRESGRIGLYRSPCGLHFFHPAIAGDGAFYGRLYRRFHARAHDATQRQDFLAAAALVRPGDAVLDCGCGHGDFARLIPQARCTGLEPHAEDHGSAPGILPESAEAHAAHAAGRYDIACAFQVLEHAEDPLAMARALAECVKPGGLLVVAMPLHPSALTALPNNLVNLPPHHLSWWSEGACRALAAELGLTVERCGPVPASPSQAVLHWALKLCPVRTAPGRYVSARWRWHLAMLPAFLAARLLAPLLGLPRSAGPIDIVLVARKPVAPR